MAKKRIQKHLSEQGICSRRQAERFIQEGHVLLNGVPITAPAPLIDDQVDCITLSKQAQECLRNYDYYAYYKARGIVTHSPQLGEQAICDQLPSAYRHCAPVGRLDKDSEGLILLTNDGLFARRCLQHDAPYSRVYDIEVSKPLSAGMIHKCESGLSLFGNKTKPCQIQRRSLYQYQFTMIEGKNRQIRRMVQKVGSAVVRLKRIRFGPIVLGDMNPSDIRPFDPQIFN